MNNEHKKQLALEDIYQSVWYDAFHDRTNYLANRATVDEDLFMSEDRFFPDNVAEAENSFLDLFVDKHIFESKTTAINPIPSHGKAGYGEMRIVDVFSGVFHGYALNEFIDPAETSTEKYLKYFYSHSIQQAPPQFDGLPPLLFPNSYLYNCDKLLFEYFKIPEMGFEDDWKYAAAAAVAAAEVKPRDGHMALPSSRPDLQAEAQAAARAENKAAEEEEEEEPDWNRYNCRPRHLYNLNCFWKLLLNKIRREFDNIYAPGNTTSVFNQGIHNIAIDILNKIYFTDFVYYKKIGRTIHDYRSYLYMYPKWSFDGLDDYNYIITRGLCIEYILHHATTPPPNVTLPIDHPANPTKEQTNCYTGLELLLSTEVTNGVTNGTIQPGDRVVVKQHFYMLLKYAGDTSHLLLYDILQDAATREGLPVNNLSIYLSERPLLVRAFAENKNIYCKYFVRFGDKSIIKSPNEVLKLTNESQDDIALRRAKKYDEDITILNGLLITYPDDNMDPDDNMAAHIVHLEFDTELSQALSQPLLPADVNVNETEMTKINNYHGIIKQIITCSQLVNNTAEFIKDIKYVNHNIINAALFKKSRRPYLPSIKDYISPMLHSALNHKKQEYLNRALEYLLAFSSILIPKTSSTGSTEIYNAASNYLRNMIFNDLGNELHVGKSSFKELALVKIVLQGNQGGAAQEPQPVTFRDQNNIDEVRIWIEEGYEASTGVALNKPKNKGIKNIAEYLIAYDLLTHQMYVGGALIGGGGMVGGAELAELPQQKTDMDIFDLDMDFVKYEIANAIREKIGEGEAEGKTEDASLETVIDEFVEEIDRIDTRMEMYNKKDQEHANHTEAYRFLETKLVNLRDKDGFGTIWEGINDLFEPVFDYLAASNAEDEGRAMDKSEIVISIKPTRSYAEIKARQKPAWFSLDAELGDGEAKEEWDGGGNMNRDPIYSGRNRSWSRDTIERLINEMIQEMLEYDDMKEKERVANKFKEDMDPSYFPDIKKYIYNKLEQNKYDSETTQILRKVYPDNMKGGGRKTRKKPKSSQFRKTIKKRILKKIKRKSLRRRKPIKKRVNSKNRKVKRKIKNKTRKYKKPKKQKRSRKPKPKS